MARKRLCAQMRAIQQTQRCALFSAMSRPKITRPPKCVRCTKKSCSRNVMTPWVGGPEPLDDPFGMAQMHGPAALLPRSTADKQYEINIHGYCACKIASPIRMNIFFGAIPQPTWTLPGKAKQTIKIRLNNAETWFHISWFR